MEDHDVDFPLSLIRDLEFEAYEQKTFFNRFTRHLRDHQKDKKRIFNKEHPTHTRKGVLE